MNSPMTLVELLLQRAQTHPNKGYAFILNSQLDYDFISYPELALKAKALAVNISKVARPGDRALIVFKPGLDYIIAFFGCLFAGVIAVPVYPPHTSQLQKKLQHIKDNASPVLMLSTKAILEKFTHLPLVRIANKTRLGRKIASSVLKSKFNKALELLDYDFYSIKKLAIDEIDCKQAARWQAVPASSDDLAMLQYTSGSTGNPKGVMLSHGNIIKNAGSIKEIFSSKEDDIVCLWLPPYHDMGLIGGILHTLYVGMQTYLMSPVMFLQYPGVWLKAISQFKATIAGGPNFAYELCADKISEKDAAQLDLSSWEVAFSGAEPIREKTVIRFAQHFAHSGFDQRAFFACYGLAESALMVTGQRRLSGIKFQQGVASNGSVASNALLKIVDAQTLQVCAEEVTGEIWVSSESVAKGYWQMPELSQQVFAAFTAEGEGPFLRTGDLGFIKQASLYVTGRIKDLIIIRGKDYYPHDIEFSLLGVHPAMRAHGTVAFSVDIEQEERLVIVQEVAMKAEYYAEIAAQIRNRVTHYFGIEPHVIALVPPKTVPKTTSGKPRRLLCKQWFVEVQLPVLWSNNAQVTAMQAKKKFETLCQDILSASIPSHLRSKALSEFGIDSLRIAELQTRIKQSLNIELPLDFLLQDPSLSELLDYISSHSARKKIKKSYVFNPTVESAILQLPQVQYDNKLEIDTVFITGATGFVGAFLLAQILRHTQWKLACLFNSDDHDKAMQRIAANMRHYHLWQPEFVSRISVVLGNLSTRQFGLTTEDYQHWAKQCQIVIHSAAKLNFVFPYSYLKDVNVCGTMEVLQFAAAHQVKQVHYLSTIGHFLAADLPQSKTLITEQSVLSCNDQVYGGYNQSKWVAEEIVQQAREFGIPTTIYRASLVYGDSESGVCNENDIISRILKGCVMMKMRPKHAGSINLVPVDYVAKAVIDAIQQKACNETFHLTGKSKIAIDDLFELVNDEFAFQMQPVEYREWVKELERHLQQVGEQNPLYPLQPFFSTSINVKEHSLFEVYLGSDKVISSDYTVSSLKHQSPSIDKSIIVKYIESLISQGYLPKLAKLEQESAVTVS